MNQELLNFATYDPLTGIYNCRKIMEITSQLLNQSKEDKEPLFVVMLDIDGFKGVNDTYRYSAGDVVIKLVTMYQLLSTLHI